VQLVARKRCHCQWTINAFSVFLIYIIVVGVTKKLIFAAVCVFLPVSIATSLQICAVIGKALNVKDLLDVLYKMLLQKEDIQPQNKLFDRVQKWKKENNRLSDIDYKERLKKEDFIKKQIDEIEECLEKEDNGEIQLQNFPDDNKHGAEFVSNPMINSPHPSQSNVPYSSPHSSVNQFPPYQHQGRPSQSHMPYSSSSSSPRSSFDQMSLHKQGRPSVDGSQFHHIADYAFANTVHRDSIPARLSLNSDDSSEFYGSGRDSEIGHTDHTHQQNRPSISNHLAIKHPHQQRRL